MGNTTECQYERSPVSLLLAFVPNDEWNVKCSESKKQLMGDKNIHKEWRKYIFTEGQVLWNHQVYIKFNICDTVNKNMTQFSGIRFQRKVFNIYMQHLCFCTVKHTIDLCSGLQESHVTYFYSYSETWTHKILYQNITSLHRQLYIFAVHT